jgi:hypothetical protein
MIKVVLTVEVPWDYLLTVGRIWLCKIGVEGNGISLLKKFDMYEFSIKCLNQSNFFKSPWPGFLTSVRVSIFIPLIRSSWKVWFCCCWNDKIICFRNERNIMKISRMKYNWQFVLFLRKILLCFSFYSSEAKRIDIQILSYIGLIN